jgi:hypothetical protein
VDAARSGMESAMAENSEAGSLIERSGKQITVGVTPAQLSHLDCLLLP